METIKQSINRSAFSMIELVFVIVIIGIMAAVSVWYLPRTELKQAAETMMTNIKYTKTLAQLDNRQFLMKDEQFVNEVYRNQTGLNSNDKDMIMNNQVANWELGMWQFQFHGTQTGTNAQNTYTIYTDIGTNFDGQPSDLDLIARDPMTKECISGYRDNNNPGNCNGKYAKEARFYDTFQTQLESIQSDDCTGWRSGESFSIFFDNKGMPYCKVGNNANKAPTILDKSSITIKLKRKNENAYICITKGGIIEGGVPLGANGQPQTDSEGRKRGIPIDNSGKCYDI